MKLQRILAGKAADLTGAPRECQIRLIFLVFDKLRTSFKMSVQGIKQIHLCGHGKASLMHVVVGYDNFGKLRSIVIPLFDIIYPCKGLDLNARRIVQIPDIGAVVVGEQEFPLDAHQGIA